MNDKNGWIPVSDHLPTQAGFSFLVSAVNPFGQRDEFIAFFGYGSTRWFTMDVSKMKNPYSTYNAVSDKWTITHWKFLDRLPRPVKLVPESDRPKAEKYRCSSCGDFCYYPHSLKPIPYRYCPNCGKEVSR